LLFFSTINRKVGLKKAPSCVHLHGFYHQNGALRQFIFQKASRINNKGEEREIKILKSVYTFSKV